MKQISHIPNRAGFRFIGITKDGKKINCVVQQDSDTGCHYAVESSTGERCFLRLKGWK